MRSLPNITCLLADPFTSCLTGHHRCLIKVQKKAFYKRLFVEKERWGDRAWYSTSNRVDTLGRKMVAILLHTQGLSRAGLGGCHQALPFLACMELAYARALYDSPL